MKKLFMASLLLIFGVFAFGLSTAVANECLPIGTGTPGYWMNHPDAWPVETIVVGGTQYTRTQAINIMSLPVKGDKTLTMFPAYVAAKLNVLIGNCPPDCYSLDEVNAWLTDFPVFSGIRGSSEAWQYSHGEALYWCLDTYNNGFANMPSRDE